MARKKSSIVSVILLLFSFVVSAAPTEPVLTQPANGQTDYGEGYFAWSLSTDSEGADILYDFYLGNSEGNLSLYQGGLHDGFENDAMIAFINEGEFILLPYVLPSNTTLFWKVVARNSNGETAESDTWSFTTDDTNYTAPAKPANPSPAQESTVGIQPVLQWDASADPDGDVVRYHLYFDSVNPPAKLLASDLASNSFRMNDQLAGNTRYYWKVVADDGRGRTTEGGVWTFTTSNIPPSPATQPFPADNAANTGYNIELSWQPSFDPDSEITRYELWYGTTAAPTARVVTTITKAVVNLQASTTYYWNVVTFDSYGSQAVSKTWTFTTEPMISNHAPAAPLVLEPVNHASSVSLLPTLRWSASGDDDQDVVYYDIYMGSTDTQLQRVATALEDTGFSPVGLKPGATYHWKVVAYDKRGGVSESGISSFTTTADDVDISNVAVYPLYTSGFSLTPLAPAFAADSTHYKVKGRTVMTNAVALALYYANPATTVSLEVPAGFSVTKDIIHKVGLPSSAEADIYQIEGDFSLSPRVTVRLQAGVTERAYTVDININQVPEAPVLLAPANGDESVPIRPTFTWEEGDDPDGDQMIYRLFLGTDPSELLPSSAVQGNKTITPPLSLKHSVKYYWKIVAQDMLGESRQSLVHSFVTQMAEPQPVTKPVQVYPRAISTYMETTFDLVWRYDESKKATYDIYLDVNNPPKLIAKDLAIASFPVKDLSFGTRYYWKVVARHPDGMEAESPVQEFITKPVGGNETGSFVDTRDGQVYQWVRIGDQQWMVHNLAYEPREEDGYKGYRYFVDASTGGREYFMLAHKEENLKKYGYLYNWSAALNNSDNPDPEFAKRGVCPFGWHIPTYEEWQAAAPSVAGQSGSTGAGSVYHEMWNIPGKETEWLNQSGLSIVSSGYRLGSVGPIISNNAAQFWLADPADGIRYVYEDDRLKVYLRKDGAFSGAASVRCVRDTNEPPTVPVLIAPADQGVNIDYGNVDLHWTSSADADADNITYDVFLDKKSEPGKIISDDITVTSVHLNDLDANATYYWKIKTVDSYGHTVESEVWTFTTRAAPGNNAPATPQVLSPANNATGVTRSPVLTWSPVTDPDGETPVYDIYFGNTPDELNRIAVDVQNNSYALGQLSSQTTFSWQVVAKDGKGGSVESPVYNFTTYNGPPLKPALLMPENAITGVLTTQKLVWEGVADPDGDQVTYEIYIGTTPSEMTLRAITPETYYDFGTGQNNATFYWRVVAIDGKGGSVSSDTWNFKTFSSAGSQSTTLKSPANNATGVSVNPTLEWNPYAGGSFFSYDLYVGTTVPALIAHDLDISAASLTIQDIPGMEALLPHTTYQWKIAVKHVQGSATETDTWTFTTANQSPSKPVLFSPSNNAFDQSYTPALTWGAVTDADGDAVLYNVYLDTSPDPQQRIAFNHQKTSLDIPAFMLKPNTTYYWKVVSKDLYGGETTSDVYSFTTINSLVNSSPSAPKLANPVSYTRDLIAPVVLEWEASVDIEDDGVTYDVYFGPTEIGISPVATGLSSLTYTLSDPLQAHTTYYWKVVARDNSGGEAGSSVWNFTTPNGVPSPVGLVSPADDGRVTSTAVTLEWTLSSDADGDAVVYDIYLDKNPDPVTKIGADVAGLTHVTPLLDNNAVYYWKVVAKDPYGGKTASTVYQFKAKNDPPSSPALNSPSDKGSVSTSTVTLNWDRGVDPDNSTPIAYDVFLDKNPLPEKKIGTVYTTYFTTNIENEGIDYYWMVVAKDIEGGSTASAVRSFQYTSGIPNQPPSKPSLQSPLNMDTGLDQDVALAWGISVDPDGDDVVYDVYLSEDMHTTTLLVENLVSTQYNLPNLTVGETYFWKIVAKDPDGETATSDIWQFTTAPEHTVSGIVRNTAGDPLEHVILQGFPTDVKTDGSGSYSVKVKEGWSGLIVPALQSYSFSPVSRSIGPVFGDVDDQDFSGVYSGVTTVAVSGVVTDTNGQPLTGVMLQGFPSSVVTEVDGSYVATVPDGWSGVIFPVLESYDFSPATRSISSVSGDLYDQNFLGTYTGVSTVAISGTVTDVNGQPLAGVVLKGIPTEVTTGPAGSYTVILPLGWSGVISAAKDDYTFMPEDRVYSDLGTDQMGQDYTGTYVGTYTISGSIRDAALQPMAGVVLTGFPTVVRSNQLGEYAVEVPPGWSGDVTPIAGGFIFSPENRRYAAISQDHTAQDYVASLISGIEEVGGGTMTVSPNPSADAVRIVFASMVHGNLLLVITDGYGREIWRSPVVPGETEVIWHGMDHAGRPVSAGMYYCRLLSGTRVRETQKVMIVR